MPECRPRGWTGRRFFRFLSRKLFRASLGRVFRTFKKPLDPEKYRSFREGFYLFLKLLKTPVFINNFLDTFFLFVKIR